MNSNGTNPGPSISLGDCIFEGLVEGARRVAAETGATAPEAARLALEANWTWGGLDVVALAAVAVARPTILTRLRPLPPGADRDWHGETWRGLDRGSPAAHMLFNIWWELTMALETPAATRGEPAEKTRE
jgi:hypothetical protein